MMTDTRYPEFSVQSDRRYTVPVDVTPEREEFDNASMVVFTVPSTLPEARSAYCHDSVFRVAVDILCTEESITPEELFKRERQQMLGVEKPLLERRIEELGRVLSDSSVEHAESFHTEPLGSIEDEVVDHPSHNVTQRDEPTLSELKQMYVQGEITIYEFENRIEEVLDI